MRLPSFCFVEHCSLIQFPILGNIRIELALLLSVWQRSKNGSIGKFDIAWLTVSCIFHYELGRTVVKCCNESSSKRSVYKKKKHIMIVYVIIWRKYSQICSENPDVQDIRFNTV